MRETSITSKIIERRRLRRDLQDILDESAVMYAAGHTLAPERFACCAPLVEQLKVLSVEIGDGK
jgi:hypothetical protein